MRDYRSFSSVAATRFRPVAQALGYQLVTGTLLARACYSAAPGESASGWIEVMALQASGSVTDRFYINCGVALPALWPGQRLPPLTPAALQPLHLSLSLRLCTSQGGQGFDRTDKAAVQASAQEALAQHPLQIRPWLNRLNTWRALAAEYLHVNSRVIGQDRLGRHNVSQGADLRAATYGALLLKAGERAQAQRWLTEAQALLQTTARQDEDAAQLLAQVHTALADL